MSKNKLMHQNFTCFQNIFRNFQLYFFFNPDIKQKKTSQKQFIIRCIVYTYDEKTVVFNNKLTFELKLLNLCSKFIIHYYSSYKIDSSFIFFDFKTTQRVFE